MKKPPATLLIRTTYNRFVSRLCPSNKPAYRWRVRRFAEYVGRNPDRPMEALRHLLGLPEARATELVNGFKSWLLENGWDKKSGRSYLDGIHALMAELHRRGVAPWRVPHPFTVRLRHKWSQCSAEFRELGERWLESRSGQSSRALELRRGVLCRLGVFLRDRGLPPAKMTSDHVIDWVRSMKGEGLASTTIGIHLQNARVFFSWLRWERVAGRNPFGVYREPRRLRRLPTALEPRQVQELLEAARDLRERAVLELLYATGCTPGEASGIDQAHFSANKREVTLKATSGQVRTVPLNPHASKAIEKYLKGRKPAPGSNALFVNHAHARLGASGIRKMVSTVSWRTRIGKRVLPNHLRHSFGTHFIDRGGDPVVLKFILGQASFFAADRYRLLATSRLRRVYERAHPRP